MRMKKKEQKSALHWRKQTKKWAWKKQPHRDDVVPSNKNDFFFVF